MIICVSANPAIDRRVRVRNLVPGAVNRAVSAESFAGGKAAHVATAAHVLGEEVVWIGFAGGATGDELERQLKDLNIHIMPIRTTTPTRINDEIIDERGNITEILEPGGAVGADEIDQMYTACETLMAEAIQDFVVVLSGSLPPGVPSNFYARIIRMARKYNGKVILDTSGEALAAALSSGPDLIKPNREETKNIVGFEIDGTAAGISAARQMQKLGASDVAISLGKDGIVLLDGPTVFVAEPPKVEVISTVGCGDAAVAGFAVAAIRNLSKQESLQLATACGTANCLAKLPGQINLDDVKRLLRAVMIKSIPAEAKSGQGLRRTEEKSYVN
jgi:1-phosphofructokinase family hexose kinase